MLQTDEGLACTSLPPGEAFFDELADYLLHSHSGMLETGDLSSLRVLVPALPMAVELRTALQRAAQRLSRPLLMPRFDTLSNWVLTAPVGGIPEPLPECERLVLLHEALREKGWFDEAALWGIASEMAGLFDEMTAAAVSLAEDEDALAEQLQRAYALRASEPLGVVGCAGQGGRLSFATCPIAAAGRGRRFAATIVRAARRGTGRIARSGRARFSGPLCAIAANQRRPSRTARIGTVAIDGGA